MRDGARTGDHDGVFRNDQRQVVARGVDGVTHEIVDGDGTVEDGAGAEDGPALDYGAFVDSGIPANKNVVFNNNGESADWLEDSANLGAGGDVAIAATLCTRAGGSVGIDHSVLADEGTGLHKQPRQSTCATAR